MKFAVAPMIDFTDKHCRYFYRIMSHHAWLFTEMITANAILNGDIQRLLSFEDEKNKTVLQIAGNTPHELARCTKIGYEYGYSHINLNVGCPSTRVQSGCFGAVLMKSADLVADCIKAMMDSSAATVSIKHRTGVDDYTGYDKLRDFVGIVAETGCSEFIIHARKAYLKGLNPKQNRTVPPLEYDKVLKLKTDFPHLNIIINGGFTSHTQCLDMMDNVDGIMLGRGVYHNAYFLSQIDTLFYNDTYSVLSREQVLVAYMDYIERKINQGVPIRAMTKHILSLYYAQPNSKEFKRLLSGKTLELDSLKRYVMKEYGSR